MEDRVKRTVAPPRQAAKAARKAEEDQLQAACFKTWNKLYRKVSVLFSVPNGAFLGTDPMRAMIEMGKLKATGLTPGVADLILLYGDAKTVFFELKTPDGVQSDQQLWFEKQVRAMGFEYIVIRSAAEFEADLIGRFVL